MSHPGRLVSQLAAATLALACHRAPGPEAPVQRALPRVPSAVAGLSIAGSGSNIPLTQKLRDAFAPQEGSAPRIPPSIGSAGAIKALQAGKLDLGLLSRPLKPAELEAGLRQRAYARLALVLAVHPSVPDSGISAADLTAIYGGGKSSWKNGAIIIVLSREQGDSSISVLEAAVPGFRQVFEDSLAKKRWEVFYTDSEENEAISQTPNSLGLSDSSALLEWGTRIKPLSYEGLAPSVENLGKGAYPLHKDLYFAYAEPLSGEARAFLDFVGSARGRALIDSNGAIALAGE
jgi:phosphate transport system substrate-binding protein